MPADEASAVSGEVHHAIPDCPAATTGSSSWPCGGARTGWSSTPCAATTPPKVLLDALDAALNSVRTHG